MEHFPPYHTLPNYGLANTVTGFATLFSGILPLFFCWLMRRQPARWHFVYWTIVVTGIFTVTLHGFGETHALWGARWFWSFLDTGSNIVVTWAIAFAAIGDFHTRRIRRWAIPAVTALMIIGVAWHYHDRHPATPANFAIPLGAWGGFYPGEAWLIGFAWLNVGIFLAARKRIPPHATPLLILTVSIFLLGMFLATADNDRIAYPFIPLHALWHLVGAYGFLALWAFNHVRFGVEESWRSPDAPAVPATSPAEAER